MRFLVDARLPRRLVYPLREADHDALHTLDVPDGNRTKDGDINTMETFVPRTIDEETIRQVRDRIVDACDPEAIVLFGSVARTEHRPGSDLDVLVVANLPPDKTNRDQVRELSDLFADRLIPMDFVVLTPEQYHEGRGLLGHIARVASREGVRIYG